MGRFRRTRPGASQIAIGAAVFLCAATASGQAPVPEPPSVQVPAPSAACARWPGSVFDEAAAGCRCPEGLWWNLRGDACLPSEYAAAELCAAAWPGSRPVYIADGRYRCACPVPLLWNEEALGCTAPPDVAPDACIDEWPGTIAVPGPSGTDHECRCPGALRWDEAARRCSQTAPVGPAPGAFFPDRRFGAGGLPLGEGGQPSQDGTPMPVSPASGDLGSPAASSEPGVETAPPPAIADGPSASPACVAMLAQIRARVAGGENSAAEAIAMQAATRGCDPRAISEAVSGAGSGN